MTIENISIIDFKNIGDERLELSAEINCFVGDNGAGKTNILDAVHYLALARSMQTLADSQVVRHGKEAFIIEGKFRSDSSRHEQVVCSYSRRTGKTLKRNGKEYDKLSEHIGQFPIVVVSPQDSRIVSGSGEERRKLMDMVISQADKTYLSQLIRYNKSLEQRNKMLRVGFKDKLLYDSIESQMAQSADYIHAARTRWVEQEMKEAFERYYRRIASSDEVASIAYRSVLNDMSLTDVFEQCRAKDEVLGYTSRGIHRDDLEMGLDGYSMRRLGSQGQLKTFTIALRFAIFEYLKRHSGVTPLLLLDDIFDKLDADRVQKIMEVVSANDVFGQIFITDTNRKHLDEILVQIGGDYRLLEVDHGRFAPISESMP